MNKPEVSQAIQGNALIESGLVDIPAIDDILSVELRIYEIRRYFERQGVLKCMQKLSEHSQFLTDSTIEESQEKWHEGYYKGFTQAHKIIDAMLRES